MKPDYQRKLKKIKFWNRLVLMDENRLAKQMFNVDYSRCKTNSFSHCMYTIFQNLELTDVFYAKEICQFQPCKDKIVEEMHQDWSKDVLSKPKLRTYKMFKTTYEVEDYLRIYV